MISNQILQNTVDGLKEITGIDLSICDMEGKVIASTFADSRQVDNNAVMLFSQSEADSQIKQGGQYFKIYDEKHPEYILIVNGVGEEVTMVGKLAVFQIQNLLVAYKERFDKDNFVKNLLLDNLLLIDIYNRAKKLHIQTDAKRVVIVIEAKGANDTGVLEQVRSLFATRHDDFVTAVDEDNVIIVRTIDENEGYEELNKLAQAVLSNIDSNGAKDYHIAIGTIIGDIKEVSRSYKEAKMALEVGKIFFADKNIVTYSTLGIGRLIYQLPISLCKMFIKEIFDNKSPDDFDEETLTTINKFFANSLNVSETSRQLYIHRNTLVYRLDKLQKNTGLDLRVFEDAITLKIALMVVKYMNYMEEHD